MAQSCEATTDRLVSVIASIQIERKSGCLVVRRGEGLTAEEGTLTFVRGQIMQANVGRRNGSEAVNWLSTWGQTYYSFKSLVTDQGTPIALFPMPVSSSGRVTTHPGLPAALPGTAHLSHPPQNVAEVPYAIATLAEALARINQAGLNRSYRRLYLLIDGNRSLMDLVPLVGRSVEEIRSMLHDLEWLGIVHVPELRVRRQNEDI